MRRIILAATLALALATPAHAARVRLKIGPVGVVTRKGVHPCPARTDMVLDTVRMDGHRLHYFEGMGSRTLLYGYGLMVYVDSRPNHRNVFRVANSTTLRHRIVIRWHYQHR